jgi:polyisoprenoid-binding protein YceI
MKLIRFCQCAAILLSGASALADTLPLDPKASSLTFTGDSFLHNFHGEAKEFTGDATLDPNAAPPIQRAELHFKTASLTTSESDRDKKMWAWMHIDTHPEATFQLDSVKLVSGDPRTATSANPAKFAVSGVFTLSGVAQPISGTATGWRAKDRVIVAGATVVDTLKAGLPQIREAAIMTVGTQVAVEYRFAFVLPPDYALK